MPDDAPDYASYSLVDLRDVRQGINREKFPERFEQVVAEIEKREREPALLEVEQKQEKRATHASKVRRFGWFFLAFGVWVFGSSVVEPAVFTFRSRAWPATRCVIVHEAAQGSTRLAFRYFINGQTYIGKRLSSSESNRKMRSWLREYQNGKEAICFVNPHAPEESVLTWGWSGFLVIPAYISVFMIAVAVHDLRHPEQVTLKGEKPE